MLQPHAILLKDASQGVGHRHFYTFKKYFLVILMCIQS